MPLHALRIPAFGLILLLVLMMGPSRFSGPAATPAKADGAEVFTQVTPAKVYSEIPSHSGLADADPTLGTTGYCVTLQFDNHKSLGPNNGFSVDKGVVLSSAYFANGSTVTTDDVYCVVVSATRITTSLPRPDMVVKWTYLEGGVAVTTTLNIKVVTVTLKGINGPAGGVAEVCTVGWDSTFLTGKAANTPPAVPVLLDSVVASDWSTNPAAPPTILGVVRDGPEWCVNLFSATPIPNVVNPTPTIDVTLKFYALYNITLSADDHLISETGTDVVLIFRPKKPELRHITPIVSADKGGQILIRQNSNANVIGSFHTVCIVPSVASDVLNANDINFGNSNGSNVSALSVFTASGALPDPPGVPAGTKCFMWTSTTPGLQTIGLRFTMSAANPANSSGVPQQIDVTWDTDMDGNNDPDSPGGTLVKPWNLIDRTVITAGGAPDGSNSLLGATVDLPLTFNAGDGRFSGKISLSEWVLGKRPDPHGSNDEPTDGVPLKLTIAGSCGYFGDIIGTKTLSGPGVVTLDGHFDFQVQVLGDIGCGAGQTIQVKIEASYPPFINRPPVVEVETVNIRTTFSIPVSSPLLAWVGQTVLIEYGFAGTDCAELPVIFTRPNNQPGTFAPGAQGAAEIGSDFARTKLNRCLTDIRYESEDPAQIDITAQLEGNVYSKQVFPVFFLAFEDISQTLNSDPAKATLTVSELGTLDVHVRAWFPGDDPSGRPAVSRGGNTFPKDRWILPDDWSTLRGPGEFRPTWAASAPMPPARITWFMQNESTVNGFQSGVRSGSSGFFVPDADRLEFDFNIQPETRLPSVLGSRGKPRIISEPTKPDGSANVLIFGDLNLTYEGCTVNTPTGNPYCKPDDLAGRGVYYVLADYPELRGKWPPLRSNDVTATFTWQGYKTLTYEDSSDPSVKYVVAHLKDRDGFCDALSLHNLLGVPVDFKIDSGSGIIIGRADDPAAVTDSRRFAITTTFDTLDDRGNPVNATLVRTVKQDDECQAWIKVVNSLETPANVLVTFAPPPSPVPGQLAIVRFDCTAPLLTIKNIGPNAVSLAGFGIRADTSNNLVHPEAHLGLLGQLAPGQTTTITGVEAAWIYNEIQGLAGASYARIIWEEATISIADCKGAIVTPPTPAFAADGEGTIVLDIIVPFAVFNNVQLERGWNLVSAGGAKSINIVDAVGANVAKLGVVYLWDQASQAWRAFFPDLAPALNTLTALEPGNAYWVFAKEPFTLKVPK